MPTLTLPAETATLIVKGSLESSMNFTQRQLP